MESERRHADRQYLRVTAELDDDEGQASTVHTIDVGIAGMALNAPKKLATALAVTLRFNIPVGGKLEQVVVRGRVSYCAPAPPGYKVGVRFFELDRQAKTVIGAYLLNE